MMRVENQTFDKEREFYGSSDVTVVNCKFEGPADGESAFKESDQDRASHKQSLRYEHPHLM